MPCEMHMGEHMFPLVLVNGKLKQHPDKPLVYGYQHDLEGIWWIILWFATMRIDQDLCREFGDLHFQQPIDRGCISRRWTLLTS
ncbi:hypothetical protein CC1G_15117 [Coprinopsis cinerea okayama7|uniref:Fungal-type protein kinase domain-containing protein n=1 Tax=Coprinopsis cinerea (strain Okayama-7 / 130 / ATCC MYA-4618 / FGSC 9003) TaxID=240176 RepID=D6RPK7_COPC7|nr:hypothetical protein CC1G_15117 [Coprinopsis cinerea okayama7\|eukprot:XP_002910476.1 hypothetical protein CC1G_15117 [Coprinopsis cinerea okayama7\